MTRGTDLLHATHMHRLLQALLGLAVPQYHHHPLVLDAKVNPTICAEWLAEAFRGG